MTEKGNPVAGVLAGLLSVVFVGGAIGVARSITSAGSKAVRAASSAKAIVPLAIADDVALSAAPDSSISARLLRQSAEGVPDIPSSVSLSEDVERSSIARYRKSSAGDEVFEESQSEFDIPEPIKTLFEKSGDQALQELLKQLSSPANLFDPEEQKSDAALMDKFIFSEAFLERYSFYLESDRIADAANVQRAVVRITAQLTETDERYLSALAYALACHTWTALLDGEHAEAVEAGQILASMSPEDRAHLDLRMALLNSAHAHLFLGNDADAIDTYVAFADGEFGSDKDWSRIIAEDFASLRKAGLENEDMDFVLAVVGPIAKTVP